jgi:hypothetical protein
VCADVAASDNSYTNLDNEVNETGLDDVPVFTGDQYFATKEMHVFALTESIGSIDIEAGAARLSGSAKTTATVCAVAFGGAIDIRMLVGSFEVSARKGAQRRGRHIRRDACPSQ